MAGLPERSAAHLTRRGSLAYYLAAWVCGSLVFSVAVLFDVAQTAGYEMIFSGKNLLSVYFLTLIFMAPVILLFGFLLRLVTQIAHWEQSWQWVSVGAVLSIVLIASAAVLSAHPGDISHAFGSLKGFIAVGNGDGISIRDGNKTELLITIVGGMATAYLLFRIDRAFAWREDGAAPGGKA